MERVIYSCKKCGWKTSIIKQWSDLKPKKCCGRMNGRACQTSFLKEPNQLLIELPLSLQKGN